MTTTNFRDLSTGFKILVVIELCIYFSSVFLAIEANNWLLWSDQALPAANIIAIYAITFALLVLLTSLSLGTL